MDIVQLVLLLVWESVPGRASCCMHHISPLSNPFSPLHCFSPLCCPQCAFVREDSDAAAAARRHLRLRRLFSGHLPPCSPPAIKPFPTTVGSSVTKTAPANIVRTPSTMAVLILLGELSPTCAVSSKFPTWKFPESVNYSYYGAEE